MSFADIPPPNGVELYAHSNGMMVIRQPVDRKGENGPPWTSVPTGTSVEAKARKQFARYLAKHKIEGIDAMTAPIMSAIGPIPAGSGAIGTYIKSKRDTRPKGTALVKIKRGGARPGAGRKVGPPRTAPAVPAVTGLEDVRALVQIIATAHASAATALRLLQERVGEPTLDGT